LIIQTLGSGAHLQQHCAHGLLWRDAGAAALYISLAHWRELLVHLRQRLVDLLSDRAQRVRAGHEILQTQRREQRFVVGVGSPHGGAGSCSFDGPIVGYAQAAVDRYLNGLLSYQKSSATQRRASPGGAR
jgi:hypothetical protein